MNAKGVSSISAVLALVLSAAVLTGGNDRGRIRPALTGDLGGVPVFFIPNRGQIDDRVAFYAQGRDKSVYFSPEGLTIALEYPSGTGGPGERWAVKLDFVGARRNVRPESLKNTGGVVSLFRGQPEEWKTGLPACSEIIYRDLWPGIDLVYKGERDQIKYEFVVRPGADPSLIGIVYRGTTAAALTAEGRLTLETPAGSFADDAPLAYQDIGGRRRNVSAAYAIKASEAEQGARIVGFRVGDYDRRETLVLDPIVLLSCGYIGGSSQDDALAVAVDASGNIYLTGLTEGGADFPATAGPDLTYNGDYSDAFVAKIDQSGAGFSYCGFIGGSLRDRGYAIAVDAGGNAYVAGMTESTQTSFPVKTGPDLTHNGSSDGFVAKVNPAGTELVYCGYIGGSQVEGVTAIALDGTARVYITGYTASSNLPVKVGPDLTYNGGNSDGFVGRVNAAGTGLDYLGYIGGSVGGPDFFAGWDTGEKIAIDAAGNAYVTGDAYSTDLPVVGGPDLTSNGDVDAYVAKIDPAGTGFVYLGYIGGAAEDHGRGMAVDADGAAYVTGWTSSTEDTFPVVAGPDLTFNGGWDGFLAKIDPSGSGLEYCGYIGGSENDTPTDLKVNDSGDAFICGLTDSSEASFPVLDGPDLSYNGDRDAFVARIDAAGTALVFCGYIGGSGIDEAYGLAFDPEGNIVVAGETTSDQATFPVEIGPGLVYRGNTDGFVARVGSGVPGPTLTSLTPAAGSAGDPGFTLKVSGSEFVDGAAVRWDGSPRPTTFVSASEVRATIGDADLAAGKDVRVTVKNPDGGVSNSLVFSIANPVPVLASLSTAQVTGGGAGFTLTVLGTHFVSNSVVRWSGSDRATTYVSATELQAAILATDITFAGEALVTVFNPAPGGGASGSMPVQVSSFGLGSDPASVTVAAGESATYTITATSQNGAYDAAVSFTCQGLPAKCTPAFSPASATPGSASATTTLTLATQAPSGSAAASLESGTGSGPWGWGLFVLFSVAIAACAFVRRTSWRLSRRWLMACALILLAIVVGSCSSGGGGDPQNNGTPKGTYVISVQGTSGNMTSSTSVTLVVN